jgi:hypothetical protein
MAGKFRGLITLVTLGATPRMRARDLPWGFWA